MRDDVPGEAAVLIDQVQSEETGDFPVERGYIWTSCASVENGNPLFWDDKVAAEITGGPVAPPSRLSTGFRPPQWAPGRRGRPLPLRVLLGLKDELVRLVRGMPPNPISFYEPVRPG